MFIFNYFLEESIKIKGTSFLTLTFYEPSTGDEKCPNNGSHKNKALDTPEAIVYRTPWTFTVTDAIHYNAKQHEECCHGEADAIHSHVTNYFVTDAGLFLQN